MGEFTTDSWCGQGAVSHDGRDALRSGIIYDGQNSYIATKVTVDVSGSGTHILKWNYTKNGSVSKRQDFGWLDQISWQAQ